ncbi:hypothetical protein [Phytomonospora endophytica]|uniref:Uncharacterized protein n=1 Tax=Phytomonospora endophytica TaxID=714109 RepID=A0A841FQN5_9ACTN|nr:hypothetical protein [Phytomonospora endophytica]MBB6037143.1 hypothetical protein [Phytomonospora endophytica]GIG71183.1 hypothetical protein Pen01_74780 [Phytomonospora endophytica]
MREEEVRGLLARTLDVPPVPASGTDDIISAGRRRVRNRNGLLGGGSALAVVTAAAVGIAILGPGGGGGAVPNDGAGPSAVGYWTPSGEPDPRSDYTDSMSEAVGEGLPQVELESQGDSGFFNFEWNEDMTAITAQERLKIEGDDALWLNVTVQEPRLDGDVDARLKDLAGCAEDCALSDLDAGRRLLTREDQTQPDDFGPRTRYQALIARPDGTVATTALWVDDNTPGTIALTMDELVTVARAIPDTDEAPIGGPAPEDTDESKDPGDGVPDPDGPADADGTLLAAVENAVATFTDAELTKVPYDNWGYEFVWGSAIGSKEFRGLLTFPDGSRFELTVEIEAFRTSLPAEDRAQLESRGKCGAGDSDCDYYDLQPDNLVLTKVQPTSGEQVLYRVWTTRSDDSYVGIFIEPFEDEDALTPPVALDTMVAMAGEIPLTDLPMD